MQHSVGELERTINGESDNLFIKLAAKELMMHFRELEGRHRELTLGYRRVLDMLNEKEAPHAHK